MHFLNLISALIEEICSHVKQIKEEMCYLRVARVARGDENRHALWRGRRLVSGLGLAPVARCTAQLRGVD